MIILEGTYPANSALLALSSSRKNKVGDGGVGGSETVHLLKGNSKLNGFGGSHVVPACPSVKGRLEAC